MENNSKILEEEIKTLKTRVNLFLSSLLWRANDLTNPNDGFVISYHVELAITNFLEELNNTNSETKEGEKENEIKNN